jgi:hypothetical protein
LKLFRIVKTIEKQIYRLKFLLIYFRIYDIFYIFLLEFYYNRRDRTSIISESIFIENQDEWAIERVLIIKTRRNRSRKYLIRWEDFSSVYDLWQLEKNLSNALDLVKQF